MAAMAVIIGFLGDCNSEICHMDMDYKHDMTDRTVCPLNMLNCWIIEANEGFNDGRTKWLPWL